MFYKFLKFKILWIRKDLKKMTKKIQKNDLIKKEKNVLKQLGLLKFKISNVQINNKLNEFIYFNK